MTEGALRVGVIGTGAIAQIIHLPLLSDMPGVRMHAVCDVDRPKARAIAMRFGVPHVFDSDDALFASDEVDAVIICSPNHLHQAQVIAALEAGKHVLVERPLALDAKGAEAAVKAAEKSHRTLMVALNNRYRPDVVGVKAFVAGRELGDVFSVRGAWYNRKVRPKRLTWRHHKATSGGGAFMDLGVQMLDLCLWLIGYPAVERVVAHLHPGENMEVEDSASVTVACANGAAIGVDVSWAVLGERDRHNVRVLATAGSATIQPLKVFKELEQGMVDVTPQLATASENAYTASYREQLRVFAAAASGGTALEAPREQIRLMRLVSAAYEAAEKGREVRL